MTQKPNRPLLPRYIALCGNPRSGKSLAQEIMAESWGVQPVDDGFPLRYIAQRFMGMTARQTQTQEGKLETVTIAGREWQVRKALGELGNALEATFGKDVLPFMALRRAEEEMPESADSFSFGSVRRDQGLVYKAAGGIVIEIRNPQAGPTGNEFDTYDTAVVDYVIENDGLARGLDPVEARLDLGHKLWTVLFTHAVNHGLDARAAAGRAA